MDSSISELIQKGRPSAAFPARVGHHDVLLESNSYGEFVYQIRGDRVLVAHANKGYREDVAAALIDAVDSIDDRELGSKVRLIPIDVPGFALDRAAVFGPPNARFFRNRPLLAACGIQVIPVHRSEAIDGEEYERSWPGLLGKNLGILHDEWSREKSPRADVWRLDDGMGGLYRRNRYSRKTSRPGIVKAKTALERHLPDLLDGVRVSATDVRGHELRLHRDWDRLRGSLHIPGRAQAVEVDIPRHAAWEAFGPLFSGADFDPGVLETSRPPEHMLMMRVNDFERRRGDDDGHPTSLEKCLRWLEVLTPTDGNFLVFHGQSGRAVQMRWQEEPEPRLWLQAREPGERYSGGHYVSRTQAQAMIEALARDDRVALEELETQPSSG